jgi:hypothetical protein
MPHLMEIYTLYFEQKQCWLADLDWEQQEPCLSHSDWNDLGFAY